MDLDTTVYDETEDLETAGLANYSHNQEYDPAPDVANYRQFLTSKTRTAPAVGIDLSDAHLPPQLFSFQQAITRWALRRGRAAIFADCGLGKTPMQLAWAAEITRHTQRPVLILAPLAVAQQTAREGAKFGIHVTVCRTQADMQPGVNITNYEMLEHFTPQGLAGIVIDESSILKSYSGSTRKAITVFAADIPYRLACTATPAPNDLIEIINHAEFLGIRQGKEIIAEFFTQDGNTTHNWRLKGHARAAFWHWLASWATALRRPSDLAYDDGAFVLPPLTHEQITVPGVAPEGMLFAVDAQSLDEQRRAKRSTLSVRVQACADLVNDRLGPWVIWCELNAEADALEKAIPGSRNVQGSDTPDYKERAMREFADGTLRVMISKPSIAGFGLNWQHCAQVAFVGLSNSFEQTYQAIRRCWRFGQQQPVTVWQVVSENEGAVVANLQRKEAQANEMMQELVANMAGLSLDRADREEMEYQERVVQIGADATVYLGDCVEQTRHIADNSVGLTVFSPPFPGMYAYTNSAHDMGNTYNEGMMIEQFKFLLPELLRVLMPGRTAAIHVTDEPIFKGVDGYVGLRDFSGEIIRAMQAAGFIFYCRITIDKNPQVKAVRTKDASLQFKSLATDAAILRPAMGDYLLIFHKPGTNPQPIRAGISHKYNNPQGWITNEEWIEWAHPIWYGINETNVLNVRQAKDTDDEKHLCPLQLDLIERAVKLWSAPGEVVFSPFMGIGSEGWEALKWNRKFKGIELKESYFRSAVENLKRALAERAQPNFLELLTEQSA